MFSLRIVVMDMQNYFLFVLLTYICRWKTM